MTWDARVCSSRSSSASSIAPRDSTPHLSLVLGSWYNGWAFGGSHRDARHDLCQEGSPMLPLAQGIVLPLLIKIFGGLLAGALAVSALNNPDVQQMIQAAKPSVGVVLSERPTGLTSGTAFVAGDRLAVTAYDVVRGASRLLIRFPDTPWMDSRVVETDPVHDLPLGDPAKLHQGDKVLVISFPGITEVAKKPATVTEGTVTAVQSGLLQFKSADTLSGGSPVLTLRGEVVGVVRGVAGPGQGGQKDVIAAAPATAARPLVAAVARRPGLAPVAAPTAPAAPGTQTGELPGAGSPQPSPVPTQPPAATPPPQPAPAPSQPPTPQPSPPAPAPAPSPVPSPTPPPSPPSPAPAPLPARPPVAPAEQFQIWPGLGIGPVRIGMPTKDALAVLGPSKSSLTLADGTALYRWFAPPKNDGVGLAGSKAGIVVRVWALNDPRYVTDRGLHVGSTEQEVRAAMGDPSAVIPNEQAKTRILRYDALGIWFSIQLDPRYLYYNQVFEIGVMPRQ